MIVSDEYNFVFIHIPKCAGTTVSNANPQLREGSVLTDLAEHDLLGVLEWPLPAHLPLWALAKYFPRYLDKIHDYSSFAVLRDPYKRFASAVIQHGREFLGMTNAELAGKRMIPNARKLIPELERATAALDHRYVHFVPQHQYVFFEGQQVVRELDLVGEFQRLNRFLSSKGLNPIAPEMRKNLSLQPANETVSLLLNSLKPIYRALLSETVKKRLWQKMIDIGVYSTRNDSGDWVRGDAELAAFVEDFYAEDLELFNLITVESRTKN